MKLYYRNIMLHSHFYSNTEKYIIRRLYTLLRNDDFFNQNYSKIIS